MKRLLAVSLALFVALSLLLVPTTKAAPVKPDESASCGIQ